jgi:CheY-like chemotaxis protein
MANQVCVLIKWSGFMAHQAGLNLRECEKIAAMLAVGNSKSVIAKELGRSNRLVARELKRARQDHADDAVAAAEHQPHRAACASAHPRARALMEFLATELTATVPAPPLTHRAAGLDADPLILIVDDDREIVRALDIRFRSKGYRIATAYDGHRGLIAALATPPDAIILDIRMPGMDGLAMLARLRGHARMTNIPAIVLSGKREGRAKSDAQALGAHCFLEKPCEPLVLMQAVQSALNGTDPNPCLHH